MDAATETTTPRLRFPHPFALLLAGVLVAALLTWVVPAGEYERKSDPETGRSIAVAETYHRVDATPVNPMKAVLAVPRGIVDGADVIVVILFVGGTFALLDRTGALTRLVTAMVGDTRRPIGILAAVGILFATLGALDNTHEEIV